MGSCLGLTTCEARRALAALVFVALSAGCGSPGSEAAQAPPPATAGDGGAHDQAPEAAAVADAGDPGTDDADSGPCAAGDTSEGVHTYVCEGMTFDVSIPAACTTAGACGLVVDVPGWTMSGQIEDDNTNARALGSKYGYVVIQPNPPSAPPATLGPYWLQGADDQHLLRMMTLAIPALGIDAKRVHMMGFSDGGMVSLRFLCDHADLFASVAPAAAGGGPAVEDGETGCDFTAGNAPSRPVPTLYMQGTKDPFVPFATVAIPQRDAIVAWWSMGTGSVVAQGTGFLRTRYVGASGAVLEFLQHDYASPLGTLEGHCYPGSTDPGTVAGQLFPFGCAPPDGFDWGQEAMAFFVAHEG